jgi:hypothetical protein
MVQASTYDNEKYLPDDYIDSLLETYPLQLISDYLKGQFVNLTSGGVYTSFDRRKNASFHEHDGFEPIYIGMDFNVMHFFYPFVYQHISQCDKTVVDLNQLQALRRFKF